MLGLRESASVIYDSASPPQRKPRWLSKQLCEGGAAGTGAYPAPHPWDRAERRALIRRRRARSNQSGGAVPGQSVPGFATTNLGNSPVVPLKSSGGIVLACAIVGVLVLGGAVLAWSHFKAGAARRELTANAAAVATSVPRVATEGHLRVAEAPKAPVASAPEHALPAVEPAISAQPSSPSVSQQKKHTPAAATPPTRAAVAPPHATPPPPTGGNKVNLGI